MEKRLEFINRSRIAQLKKEFKIIGFGAGVIGLNTIRFLDNPFDYFIDNSKDKLQSQWKEYTDLVVDVRIEEVDFLKQEDINKIAVIICSEHYQHMAKQLQELFPEVTIYLSPVLKDYETFNQLLNCSENVLVSAYGGAGGLYLLNGRNGQYRQLSAGSYRGLTRYNDKIIVGTEKGDIFRIDSFDPFEITLLFKTESRTNTHGIFYWEELKLLFVTETLNDCISVYEMPALNKIEEIPLSHKSEKKGGNYHHVNDLCLYKDKLYLSVISKSGNFYNHFLDGVILELDYKNNRHLVPVCENLLFPHAVKEIDGRLMLLNSFDGDILSVSKQSLLNLPGFIRGIDSFNKLIYVGQSRHRLIDKAKLYFNGVSMDSGVYIADLGSKIHRFVKMPEMCDIFNLMIVDDLISGTGVSQG